MPKESGDLETYIKILEACNTLSKINKVFTSLDIEKITGIENKEYFKYFPVVGSNQFFNIEHIVINHSNKMHVNTAIENTEILDKLGFEKYITRIIGFERK